MLVGDARYEKEFTFAPRLAPSKMVFQSSDIIFLKCDSTLIIFVSVSIVDTRNKIWSQTDLDPNLASPYLRKIHSKAYQEPYTHNLNPFKPQCLIW